MPQQLASKPGPHRRHRSTYEPSDASSFYFSLVAPDAGEVVWESELDGWGEGKPMQRSEDDKGKWELTVDVPWAGDDLEFKFRVDGKWKLSPDYPTRKTGEYENNYVHIPVVEVSQPAKSS
ncbi:hypothetical protein M427DRAFT_70530 [Gonapodya prolifera JEL478]|uniref:AMP-activated protein kinase glycogen-binding domain-containing protein n=1 Tax=Gonapodya prolifera (strain JEL478) TaxID=1344416 RepID=A0A139ACH8_GONPJ|nr:hypothetical protein M427DRAFT_70530 [Gonapodya prolifera JEL478]|eukprot:KXS14511.1 hypothetical protein M427DRAFT_70530 [Gonapodya prolifera JEL478]